MIPYVPTDAVQRPKGTRKQRRSLTDAERQAMLKAAETHRGGAWVMAMLYCGPRRGETVALKWKDINFKTKEITIKNAAEYETNSNQPTLKDTKTEAGYRTVPMPDQLVKKLKTLPRNGEYVFTTAHGKQLTLTALRRMWNGFMRQANIEAGAELYRNKIIKSALDENITIHYLRHTYATDLYRMGVDLKTAQYLLGHADIQTTANIYTHAAKEFVPNIAKKQQVYYQKQDKLGDKTGTKTKAKNV
jgi:integrase